MAVSKEQKIASGLIKSKYADNREILKQEKKPYKRMMVKLRAKAGLKPHENYPVRLVIL